MKIYRVIIFIFGLFVFLPQKVNAQQTVSNSLSLDNSQGSVYVSGTTVNSVISAKVSAKFNTCNQFNSAQQVCNGVLTVYSPENLGLPVDLSDARYIFAVNGTSVPVTAEFQTQPSSSYQIRYQLPQKMDFSCNDTAALTINNIKILKAIKTVFSLQVNCSEFSMINGTRVQKSLMKQNLSYSNTTPIVFGGRSNTPVNPSVTQKSSPTLIPSSFPSSSVTPSIKLNETSVKSSSFSLYLEKLKTFFANFFSKFKLAN